MTQEEREYGWDEPAIEKPEEGEFKLLPDGVYPFVVATFERGRHTGSEKLPPCNMATIHLRVNGGEHGEVTVQHKLFLHSKTQGLLSQFFKGIGHRKEGEPLVMNWSKVPGSSGYVKLGKRTYNGREFQDVKGFETRDQQPTPNYGDLAF